MFTVAGNQLLFGGEVLGSTAALYVEPSEFPGLTEKDGVVRRTMPRRVDAVFVVDGKVVGCESKKPQDLVDSTRSRRLHRQMRTLIEIADIPVLLIRGALPVLDDDALDTMFNLVCLQRLGVTILPCPVGSRGALKYLLRYRDALSGESRTPLSALRGTDERKVDAPQTLLGSIRGVGSQLEAKLMKAFGSQLSTLGAMEQELVEAGAPKKVAKRIKELVA